MSNALRIDTDSLTPFELLEEAGAGGMGTVYRARDRHSGDLLAVKLLGGVADRTRFAVETEILAKLRHPAIVAYRGHGYMVDGTPYLAMEWIDGWSLEERLRDQNLPVEEALRVARAIADGLVVAHAAGIIHRDLKPTNVLIARESGAVKIVDFGIARDEESTGITNTGQAVGSAGYMSPEQARGTAIDHRSDLFSLGCLLFRAVSGRRPFGGADLLQFATALALEEAPLLRTVAPHVPLAVEALVAELLAKDPANRPDSALHVRRAIDRILDASDATHPVDRASLPSLSSYAPRSSLSAVAASVSRPTFTATTALEIPDDAWNGSLGETDPTAVHGRGAGARSNPPPPVVTETQRKIDEVALTLAGIDRDSVGLPERRKRPRRVPFGFAMGGAIAVAGLGFIASATHRPASASVTSEATSAGGAMTSTAPLGDRAALDRACRTWAGVIAQGQSADGAFAGETRNDPTGWDTGQQLFALTEARRACDGVPAEVIANGVRALDRLRTFDKHAAKKRPEDVAVHGFTPSNAWALLALDAAGRESGDATTFSAAARARADLVAAQNPDGGFRHNAVKPGASTPYATLLATWALLEDLEGTERRERVGDDNARDPVDESVADPRAVEAALAAGIAWLKQDAVSGDKTVHEPGFTEQLAWTLAKVAKRQPVEGPVFQALVADIVTHCRLQNGGACGTRAHETGRIKLNGDAGRVVTFWHPWATAASFELLQQPEAGQADNLRAIARWGATELGRTSDQLASISEYKLSEHLMVVAELLLAQPPPL